MTTPQLDPRSPSPSLHPVLANAFAAMDAASIRWALLRIPGRPEAPTGDVDLLVHPADAAALAGVLRPLGFVALPWRARRPDLVFIAFDHGTGTWLVLDVATEMSFGRDLRFRVGNAGEVLRRSRACGALRTLSPDDGFWALLLHCLLEKEVTKERHRATLSELVPSARPDGPMGRVVDSCCPAGWGAATMLAAVRDGCWDELDGVRGPLREAWERARPDDLVRARRLRLRRLLRGPATVLERRGLSVVLLGPNGAGKSTVADKVLATYPGRSHLTYLGLWKQTQDSGRARAVLRVLARPLVVWLRYGTSLAQRAAGALVLFDRYVYDAVLPPSPPLVALKRPYLWMLAHSCPPPTATIILDVPGEVAWRRKGENSIDELESERTHLHRLSERRRRVHVIDATRPVDEVVADVSAVVWSCYVTRWTRS